MTRYASDLGLNNHIYKEDIKCDSTTKEKRRVKSASTVRKPINNSEAKPRRRVQSAKERRNQTGYSPIAVDPHSHASRPSLKAQPAFITSSDTEDAPHTLQTLAPYISYDIPECLDHPALRGSIVILPGLGTAYGAALPALPEPHSTDDDYPHTHDVPAEHVHKPKKYSHPYYERLKKIKGWTCNHSGREVRVGSLNGETIHRFVISQQRSSTAIRSEIVELERLIKGLSTEWGTSTVALYQNEINDLQTMVKHTLSLTSQPESPPPTPDLTGMRTFCKEYDTALQALIARHEQCMTELHKLEDMESLYERAKSLDRLA